MKKILLALIPFALACPAKKAENGTPPATATPTAVASASPAPTVAEPPKPLYLLRDTGKRCITSPCPSWSAVDVDTRVEREITGIDLSALPLDVKSAESARQRVLAGQVWVHGEITKVPMQGPAGAGTVLVISGIVETGAPSSK